MRIVLVSLFAVFPMLATAAGPEPKNDEQKTLYAIGLAISQNLETFNLTEAELEMVKSGLTDGVLKKTPQADLQTYGPRIGELQQARLQQTAEKEKAAGKQFAEKAAAEKDSKKTASGLVYTQTQEGKGASPKATDNVKVHYEGKLTNGNVFDSSVKRGEPVTFGLNQVIPCWTEGLQMMKVGGKARLTCPSDIAYGDMGRPPRIPPGATLVFDVELIDIVASADTTQQKPQQKPKQSKPQAKPKAQPQQQQPAKQ